MLIEGQRGESHKGVVMLFGMLLVKTGKFVKKWGKFLANLKDDREAGDYDVLSYLDADTAGRSVKEAEEFVRAVERYVGNLAE